MDDVYVECTQGSLERFQWVKLPASDELAHLTHTIAAIEGKAIIDNILIHLQEKVVSGPRDLLPQSQTPPAELVRLIRQDSAEDRLIVVVAEARRPFREPPTIWAVS